MRIAELEKRAIDVQLLKFGQTIDMELLDKIGSTRGAEDLRDQLRAQEAQYAKELAEWDARIEETAAQLTTLTSENTQCLNAVSELTRAQREIESALGTTKKAMFEDPISQRRREVEERDRLVALVNGQAKTIEQLKSQVLALKRKDVSLF